MAQTRDKIGIRPGIPNTGISPHLLTAGCILIFAVSAAYAFRGAWNPAHTIEGADASLWVPMFVRKWTHGLLVPRWFPHFLAGIGQQFQFLSHGLPVMLMFPAHRFHGFEFMLDTFLAGVFMFAFLRSQRIGHFGALVGGLSFQLGNSLLTSARQGGLWRFDTACWVPLFLLFFSQILDDDPRRVRTCLFAGAALGLQFLGGEVQLAYYVCILALAYFAFDSIARLRSSRQADHSYEALKAVGTRLVMAALCTIIGVIFAAEVFCSYLSFANRNENVGVLSKMDNWQFATEFSFAPKETVSLALSGDVFGDGLHPESVMGRRIVRITDDYLGIAVVMFAFLGVLSGKRRAYFFGCAAIAALVISFGRYFPPPYRLIYALPAMKGFRNPHKWLFITALCFPILAGIGADYWRNAPASKNRGIVAAIIIFALLMLGIACVSPAVTPSMSVACRPVIILIIVSTACILGRLWKFRTSALIGIVLPSLIVVSLAGDLIGNASKFIKYYDYRHEYVEDDVVKWLRAQSGPFRVKLWTESPYLRKIATEVLPYHGMDVVDAIMSRRPERYSEVFQAVRDGCLPFEKLFQLFNVRYVLSATPVEGTNMPLKPAATFRYAGGPSPPDGCYVYELTNYLPRAYIVNRFVVKAAAEIIDTIGGADFNLHRTVALEKQPDLAAQAEDHEPLWTVRDLSQAPHRVSMHVSVDRPAILVLQDFMDEGWHAHINTEEVEILRANYLMRAIVIPEGTHRITFTYSPAMSGYTVTMLVWIGFASAVLFGGVRRVLSGRHGRT